MSRQWKDRGPIRHVIPRTNWRSEQLEANERDMGVRDVEELGFVNLYYYFSAAADRYKMKSINVDAAVLKAEWVWPVQPNEFFWDQYINRGLDIAEVPGDTTRCSTPRTRHAWPRF